MSVGGRLPTGPTQLRHPQGGGAMTMGREGGSPEPGTYIPMYLCVYIHIHILHTYIYICAYVCVAVYVAVCVCDNVLEHPLALSSDSQPWISGRPSTGQAYNRYPVDCVFVFRRSFRPAQLWSWKPLRSDSKNWNISVYDGKGGTQPWNIQREIPSGKLT